MSSWLFFFPWFSFGNSHISRNVYISYEFSNLYVYRIERQLLIFYILAVSVVISALIFLIALIEFSLSLSVILPKSWSFCLFFKEPIVQFINSLSLLLLGGCHSSIARVLTHVGRGTPPPCESACFLGSQKSVAHLVQICVLSSTRIFHIHFHLYKFNLCILFLSFHYINKYPRSNS